MIAAATDILSHLKTVNKASRKLVRLTDKDIHTILNEVADLTLNNIEYLLAENKKDLDRMDTANPKYDRFLNLAPMLLLMYLHSVLNLVMLRS